MIPHNCVVAFISASFICPFSFIWQSPKGSCEIPTGLGKIGPALFAAECPRADKQRQEPTKQAKFILVGVMRPKRLITNNANKKCHNEKNTKKLVVYHTNFLSLLPEEGHFAVCYRKMELICWVKLKWELYFQPNESFLWTVSNSICWCGPPAELAWLIQLSFPIEKRTKISQNTREN